MSLFHFPDEIKEYIVDEARKQNPDIDLIPSNWINAIIDACALVAGIIQCLWGACAIAFLVSFTPLSAYSFLIGLMIMLAYALYAERSFHD